MDKLLKFNNKLIKSGNRIVCKKDTVDPYNPLNLPANTVRVRTNDGNVPDKANGASYETATLVPGTSDVYDVYKSGTSLGWLFNKSRNVIEVLGANTSNVTNMNSMFANCTSLQSVPLFDTSKVTIMRYMFYECNLLTSVPLFDTSMVTDMYSMLMACYALQSVPLFDTSKVTDMNFMLLGCSSLTTVPLFDTSSAMEMLSMFKNCTNVQSGALALYQQASTQANPPSRHSGTFQNCGSNTQTGAAELAQIPDDWK